MLQQGRLPADAVLGTQAPVGQLANGSVEPGPGGIHDHTGLPVHQFGDGRTVAHRWLDGALGRAHGPRAAVGMAAPPQPGSVRSSPISRATGSCCCWAAVASTLASTCQVVAPFQVALPPQGLRLTTAGRMACSARQLVACTSGMTRKVNSASRSRPSCASSLRLAQSRSVRPAAGRPPRPTARPPRRPRPGPARRHRRRRGPPRPDGGSGGPRGGSWPARAWHPQAVPPRGGADAPGTSGGWRGRNLRYGVHPSRSNTPANPSPSTAAASVNPRPGAMRYTTTPCPAKAHSQARRPPTRQPVSSGATTGLACTPSASAGVGRLAAARRPRHRLGHPTRGDLKAELAEQPGDLAGRQPQPLVAPGGQRDRARADLDAGRAQ